MTTEAKQPYELRYDEDAPGYELIRVSDGEAIGFDWGEPEDRTFTRDFRPVVTELNRVAHQRDELLAALKDAGDFLVEYAARMPRGTETLVARIGNVIAKAQP
jgi:hypothetical protein